MKKSFCLPILIIIVFLVSWSNVLAVQLDEHILGGSETTGDPTIDNEVMGIMGKALGVASVVGVAIALSMLVFVGIKIMSAAPSEKAEIKKYLTVYVVGAVCILGAVFVLNFLSGFGAELTEVMKK